MALKKQRALLNHPILGYFMNRFRKCTMRHLTFRRKRASQNIAALLIISAMHLSTLDRAHAQSSIKFAGVESMVDEAIELVYQKKYDAAIEMCRKVIERYPDNPLGYFGEAGVYHIVMLNYRVSLFEGQFDSLLSLAIQKSEMALKKYPNDPNAYFVAGAAYGFRGLNRIRKGQWFGAFRDGVRGVSNMMKAHEMNPELWDVYYGLGLYYYWKSAKAKVLTFLRLMKDEREKGMEYLQVAIDKGRFSKTEAVFALIEIYYYEDRYEEALQTALSLEYRFQSDPTWTYLTAKIFDKLNRFSEAETYFRRLLELLEAAPYQANSYLAECHYGIARCRFEAGDYRTAREFLDKAYVLSSRWDKQRELEGPLLDFDKVLQRMNELQVRLASLTNDSTKGE